MRKGEQSGKKAKAVHVITQNYAIVQQIFSPTMGIKGGESDACKHKLDMAT